MVSFAFKFDASTYPYIECSQSVEMKLRELRCRATGGGGRVTKHGDSL